MTARRSEDPWTEHDELILRAAARLRRGLQRDDLTGLLGFSEPRYAEAVGAVLADFVQRGVPLSIVVAGLDQFEVVNDNYGRAACDEALGVVGHALRELVRPLDMVMRGDGGGFKVIFLGADVEVAVARSERARATLKQLVIRRVPTGVTASFGVAAHTGAETATELLLRAEGACGRASALGRDRVEVARAQDGA